MTSSKNKGGGALNSPAPSNSNRFAKEIVFKEFGIQAEATMLACERDQIFLLDDSQGGRSILRFINPEEDPLVSNFQTEALLHVARVAPGLPVPEVILNRSGQGEINVAIEDGRSCVARLITCIPGISASRAGAHASEFFHDIGRSLAKLDMALTNFSHPAESHDLLWNVARASEVRKLLFHVEEDDLRQLANQALDNFEQHALPVMPTLRKQVIHNDVNLTNVIVDEKNHSRVTGIIDFGDMVRAPIINELAVSLSFHLGLNDESFNLAAGFVGAFHELFTLESEEIEILYDLTLARAVMTVAISGARAIQYPENRDFIMKNNSLARGALYYLAKINRERGRDLLMTACQ